MKVGEVVQIRVNPRDCMGVADVVARVIPDIQGMSFSQAVSIALSTLLETARQAKQIPERGPFEYSTVLAPFVVKKRTARKLEITQAFQLTGAVSPLPTLQRDLTDPRLEIVKEKMDQLDLKRSLGPEAWSEEDEGEWVKLCGMLCGDVPLDELATSGRTAERSEANQ